MTTFCFDTDVISQTIRPDPPLGLVRRVGLHQFDEQLTTAITAAELLYGAARDHDTRRAERVRAMLASFRIVPFDGSAARVFGSIRAELVRRGRPLEANDLMIAAICLVRDLTLVTGNVRHFERVPGLRVENWLEG